MRSSLMSNSDLQAIFNQFFLILSATYEGNPRINANPSVISSTFSILKLVYMYIIINYRLFEIRLLF